MPPPNEMPTYGVPLLRNDLRTRKDVFPATHNKYMTFVLLLRKIFPCLYLACIQHANGIREASNLRR